jgi:hypothetical protein
MQKLLDALGPAELAVTTTKPLGFPGRSARGASGLYYNCQ